MKKTFLRFAALLLVASLSFTACKKTDTTTPGDPATENGILGGRAAGNPASLQDEPTGDLQITEELHNALMDGQYVEAKVAAPHRYIGVRPIPWPQDPQTDPCAQDWIDFQNYMNTYGPMMQAWANKYCIPYRGCWQGKCVAIAFFVRPTRLCDIAVKYEEHVKVFE